MGLRIRICQGLTEEQAHAVRSKGGLRPFFTAHPSDPDALPIDCQGAFWITDHANPQIQERVGDEGSQACECAGSRYLTVQSTVLGTIPSTIIAGLTVSGA